MGNRITDIGRMKSNVDISNRTNMSGTKKRGKLVTEKDPAIVKVQSKGRFEEVSSIFNAHGWNYRIGLEPQKPEDVTDLNRLLNPIQPIKAEKKSDVINPANVAAGKSSKAAVQSNEAV